MFFAAMAVVGLLFASCNKKDYKSFVGTWGVEKIIYENYNTDWQGNPIPGSMETETFTYDPEDIGNGIQLVFRENKTGEMHDNDVDTVWIDTVNYIVNPDTTLVTKFTYSYDKEEAILYMNLTDSARTYMMKISDLTDNSFTYENNYDIATDNRKYIETAYMKRISGKSAGARASKNGKCHPRLKGSLFGD
jgi:hypothetical protein